MSTLPISPAPQLPASQLPASQPPARLPQPLHIFRKDLRHLWPETLIVLLLFVAFAWSAPSGWTASEYAAVAQLLAAFLHILMPVSWLVLISRLIHDEPLVGDRQFWTSRPYHWAKLLTAKLLFLLAFIYLPFLLMQVYLLKHAGLFPTLALPALGHNLLLLTVLVIVPITAIAAVTATFARLLVSILLGIVYLLVVAGVVGWITYVRMVPPHLESVLAAVAILLPLAALVYQYATRRTAISRGLLLAIPLLVAILLLLAPAASLIRGAYPLSAANSSDPKLGPLPEELRPKSASPSPLRIIRKQVDLGLPFTVTGADEQSNYVVKGASATIDAPGIHWSSPYFVGTARQINASQPISAAEIPIPLTLFNQLANTPADVHLSLATDHLKAEPPSTWKATLLPFAVPGHGICSYNAEAPDQPPTCRYPFSAPELNFLNAPLAVNSCSAPAGPPVPGRAALGGHAAFLDFDPVLTIPIFFNNRPEDPRTHYLLCPGTPLTFIEAKSVGKVRLEVEAKQLLLNNYAARISNQDFGPPHPETMPAPQ